MARRKLRAIFRKLALGLRFLPWFSATMRLWLVSLIALSLGSGPLLAKPAAMVFAADITPVDVGVFCAPMVARTETAPGTKRGFVRYVDRDPTIEFHQQEVPAALGVAFGLLFKTNRDIDEARMETWKPGATSPEIWFTDITAGASRYRGFTFEYPDELIPGPWRLEAWEGEHLLYRVEFEVVAADALPGMTAACQVIS